MFIPIANMVNIAFAHWCGKCGICPFAFGENMYLHHICLTGIHEQIQVLCAQ